MEEGLRAPADDHSPGAVLSSGLATTLGRCQGSCPGLQAASWGEGSSGQAVEGTPPACWLVDLPQNVVSKGEGARVRMWAPGGLALTLESPSELDWKLRESRGVICSLFDIFGV